MGFLVLGLICTGFGFLKALVLGAVTDGFSADAVQFCVECFLVCASGGVTCKNPACLARCLPCTWRQVFQGRHLAVLTHGVVDLWLGNHSAAAPWGRGRDAAPKPWCAQVCTGVCVGGWGQRAESRVGSCRKIRLPSTRHTEGFCVCPGHVFTPFALPGAGFVTETSELATPPGPPGQGSLRLRPVTGFLPLLTCPARAPFPDSQSGSKDKCTHSPGARSHVLARVSCWAGRRCWESQLC